jgi:putative transposase
MPNYRRAAVAGGSYFFTLVTYRRRRVLCNEDIRSALREAIRSVRAEHPFAIDAWVLLPDHVLCIWTLPVGDDDYPARWAKIKRFVTQRCGARYPNDARRAASNRRRNEGALWQRRYWEHLVRDPQDLNRCRDYVHWNPVRHGHVRRVRDWPYSTFHRFVRSGLYPLDWGGGDAPGMGGDGFGE